MSENSETIQIESSIDQSLAGGDLNMPVEETPGNQATIAQMTAASGEQAPEKRTYQIGVSRPALSIEDLPTPEEVFKVKHIGLEELILFVLGPSVIALGIAVGSGEWLLGPLNISQTGFAGIGWMILISALLQVFYNVELARFTIATGEAPVVAFGRTPPGYLLWVPLTLLSFYIAFMSGSWAVSAGESLFALIYGRPSLPEEIGTVRTMAVVLMASVFLLVVFGRKVARTLEAFQGIILAFVFSGLIIVTLVVVPLTFWQESLVALMTPTLPREADASLLGALAGFTALAAGLNFMFIGYYRDKGYGMGSKIGAIAGLLAARRPDQPVAGLQPVGVTFPEDAKNTALWKRWFRYLLIDQWAIFFPGALIGILVPMILVGYLVSVPGAPTPDRSTIAVYAAGQLGNSFGPILSGWALLMGFLILYTTQVVILELLTRNFTDAVFSTSGIVRRLMNQDPRWLYYPIMIFLIGLISLLIRFGLPVQLLEISGNLSNLAALIFPLALIYLNRQLPKPARITWWSYLVLLANVIFFGFFFINFLYTWLLEIPFFVDNFLPLLDRLLP